MEDPILKKQAFRAYQAIKKKHDKTEIIDSLKCFQFYLVDLCTQINKKTPKYDFIFLWTFSNEVSEKDIESYFKANLLSASESLKRIINKLQSSEINLVLERLLIDFICDLKPFIIRFDKAQDYNWLLMNTNSHISNFYNHLAENIFWTGNPGKHEQEQLILSTSTPFVIRQSIEYKIKRILGIDFISKNGKIHKTQANTYFKALKSNLKYYQDCKLNFEKIEKIHTWSHYFVHGGYRPEPWRTECALNYLKDIFYSGETSLANSVSLYASIEIYEKDLENLKRETEEFIKNEIGNDIEIWWLTKPEAAIIKDKK